MTHVVYRKKGLYYKKYGYKITCWTNLNMIGDYARINFKKEDYRIIFYQGIYFKNEDDFEKTYKKFKNASLGVLYRPAQGYENVINTSKNLLWYSRFPFRIQLNTRYNSHSSAHKTFNKMSQWCHNNLESPYHASFPSVFVMTKLDVIAIKMRFSQHIKITDQRVDSKKSKKLLQQRVKEAQDDLKIFLSGE